MKAPQKKQLSNELIELSKNGMTIKQKTEVQNKVAEIISDDLKNRYLDTLNKTLKSSYDDYKKNRKKFYSVVNEILVILVQLLNDLIDKNAIKKERDINEQQ